MKPIYRTTCAVIACALGAQVLLLASAVSTVPLQRGQAPVAEPIVSLEWLRKHHEDPNVVVIAAAKDRAAFERGHIPGSRFLGHEETLSPQGHRLLPPADLARALAQVGATDGARIVIYGDEPMVVGWVFVALASIGHGGHTSVLDGNFAAWRAAGHPVATGAAPPASGTLTPRPAADVAVERAWVRDHISDQATRLLDVRSPDEWRGGTIPTASPVSWRDFYADVATGRFKPLPELRGVFERAGLGAGQTAVTYCAVGMRASLGYFVARAAGFPARVYIGSWADWTSDPSSPIARK